MTIPNTLDEAGIVEVMSKDITKQITRKEPAIPNEAAISTKEDQNLNIGSNLNLDPNINKPTNTWLNKHDEGILSIIEKMSFFYPDSPVKHEASNPPSLDYIAAERLVPPAHTDHVFLKSHDVSELRKDFPILHKKIDGHKLIWLDNAATSQKPQIVIDTLKKYYEHMNSNIHRGNHSLSKEASDMYENTREKVANFIHAQSQKEIVFVRGATEGINFVANTYGQQHVSSHDEIIISAIEHHSNILPWQVLAQNKRARLRVIPIDQKGNISLDEYASMLSQKTKIVAITQVSNALGTVLPVKIMTQMAHHVGACVLIDAQSVPHFNVDVSSIDCDFAVFSGHKMFAPTGIGAVYGKEKILSTLPPWQLGGGMIEKVTFEESTYAAHPYRFEAGTGSIAEVAGLGAAIDYLNQIGMDYIFSYEKKLMTYAIQKLSSVPNLIIIGSPRERIGSLPFIMKGIDTMEVGDYLNTYGIALRTGHHCAQPTMQFYGVESMVRPSFAFYNTYEDIDFLTEVLKKLAALHHA